MTEEKKIKVFVISDHPFAPSGVGTQTRYVIESLLKTGRYQFICFGGAVEHPDYTPQKNRTVGRRSSSISSQGLWKSRNGSLAAGSAEARYFVVYD